MSSEAIEVRNRAMRQASETARVDSNIVFTGIAIFLSALSLLFGGLAFFVAFKADQEAEVTGIYVQRLEAELHARGIILEDKP